MSNLLIWTVGLIGVGSALIGSYFLHENVSRRWLIAAAAIGLLAIIFVPRGVFSSSLVFFLVGEGLLLATFILLAPLRQGRIFKLGSSFGKPIPATSLVEKDTNVTESILANIFTHLDKERQVVDSPPVGYWSIVFPKNMVLNQTYAVRINLPPLEGHDPWLEAVRDTIMRGKEAKLVIKPLVGESLRVEPNSREIFVPSMRSVPTEFFVTPTNVGQHQLRFEVYNEGVQLGWIEGRIRARINMEKWISLVASMLGLVGVILGILKSLRLLP